MGELFSSSQRAHFFFSLAYKLLQLDPSGRKGSLTYGLGADFSLPHCLATGIRTFDLKAITWQKSRGNIVWYDALVLHPEVQRLFACFYRK